MRLSIVALQTAATIILLSSTCFSNPVRLPLFFTENKGQVAEQVKFVVRGPGGAALFTDDSVVFNLAGSGKSEVLKVELMDAKPQSVEGLDLLEGKVNYLRGKDPSNWNRNVRTYGGIIYRNLWPGIDMVYKGEGGKLKYDVLVSPNADLACVKLRYEGVKKLSTNDSGDLIVETLSKSFTEKKPGVYQEKNGEKIWLESSFVVQGDTVGFDVKGYDPSLPLVIDPASDLMWGTFIGGGSCEYGVDMAVDSQGYIYVTGTTRSIDFPLSPGAYDTTTALDDVFVTKLNPSGTALIYSTVIGGADTTNSGGFDSGTALAVDSTGCVYVTGQSDSTDFPTTPGAYNTQPPGAFVTKLDASGSSLVYSTILPSSKINDVAVDSNDYLYVAGSYSEYVYVAKLNQDGSALVYSKPVSWSAPGYALGIALGTDGSAYITGVTYSAIFPVTDGAYDRTNSGGDAFVTKVNPQGNGLIYSTFLGGSAEDTGKAISVDSSGCAYVIGNTDSANFPTTTGVLNRAYKGNTDIFVTKLNASGSSLLYSTYLGGTSEDYAKGIAVDSQGKVYITGYTVSQDFPFIAGALSTSKAGFADAFLAGLNPAATKLSYSTFLGGSQEDEGQAIAINPSGKVLVAGETWSGDFLTTPDAADRTMAFSEAFVTAIDIPPIILVVDCIPSGKGTTTPAAGSYAYAEGVNVPVSVTAAPGYVFDHWTGDVTDPTSPSTSVTMNGSRQVTAVLVPALVRVKSDPDGTPFTGTGCIVTASFPGFFYIETDDRCAGVRVDKQNHGIQLGSRVNISGSVATNQDGERYIAANTVNVSGSGSVQPLSVTGKSLGDAGLSSTGLLVRTWGKVVQVSQGRFVIDDGSQTYPEVVVPNGITIPMVDSYVVVTAISSCRKVDDKVRSLLRVRSQSDIFVIFSGTSIEGKVTRTGMGSFELNPTISSLSSFSSGCLYSWTIKGPEGTSRIRIHFSKMYLQDASIIYLKDSSGILRQYYFNTVPGLYNVWSDWITGDTICLDFCGFDSDSRVGIDSSFTADRYEADLTGPAAGVTVRLLPYSHTAVTGTDGRYMFSPIPAGSYNITPSLAGYTFQPEFVPVTVTTGQYKLGIDFTMN